MDTGSVCARRRSPWRRVFSFCEAGLCARENPVLRPGALVPRGAGFALAWRRAWRGLWEQAGSGFRFSGKRRCAPGKRASELHALSGSAQGSSEMGRRERSAESGESGERAWSERVACLRGVPASSLISFLCSPLFPLFGG